jgi:hypothetical protein
MTAPDPAFRTGALVFGAIQGDVPRLFRVVHVDAERDIVCLLDVEDVPKRGSSRMPLCCSLSRLPRAPHNVGFVPAQESLRWTAMDLPEDRLTLRERETRDALYEVIRDLVESPADYASVCTGIGRADVLKRYLAEHPVRKGKFYQVLTRFWTYGCNISALVPNHRGRGRKPVVLSKTKRHYAKPGRPNANAELDPESRYRGVPTTPADLKRFERYLKKCWVKQRTTLAEAYETMLEEAYVVTARAADGSVFKTPIDRRLVPTLRTFYHHARRLVSELGLDRERYGDHDFTVHQDNRSGTAADITLGPTDIYDVDRADFKVFLRAEWNRRVANIKPSVVLVVDRASGAIVGFHVHIGAESWLRYRIALYSALAPKEQYLRHLGYSNPKALFDAIGCPDLTWKAFDLGGKCNEIYCDRGPARSHQALQTIRSVRIGRCTAPPRRPELKAVVESVIGRFQTIVARLRGGHTRRKDVLSLAKAKDASSKAVLTLRTFRHVLIAAITDHNEFFETRARRTSEMERAGTPPVPFEIFRWGLENVRGHRPEHLNDGELYFRLLPTKRYALTEYGVRHGGAYFNSTELMAYRLRHLHTRRPSIEASFDGLDPYVLNWNDDGVRRELLMREADRKRFEQMTAEDVEWHAKHDAAQGNIRRIKRANKAYIPRAVAKALADSDGAPEESSSDRKSRRKYTKAVETAHQRNQEAEFSRRARRSGVPTVASELDSAPDHSSESPQKEMSEDERLEWERFQRAFRNPEE